METKPRNMDLVSMPRDVAKALYNRLLAPMKDQDGNTVYIVTLALASEIRNAIFDQVK